MPLHGHLGHASAGALHGDGGYDAQKCSEYMKNFRDEGRGAVCGLCMKACPLTKASIGTNVTK